MRLMGQLSADFTRRSPTYMVLLGSGPQRFDMKTTIEVPDDLYREAKALAAMRGRRLKDLVAEGLRLAIQAPESRSVRPSLAELMAPACGVMESGVPDLATNPAYMEGFGRDGGGHT